ncbi:hypothetical protein COBT_004056, partial [Conglomerata obtusa]
MCKHDLIAPKTEQKEKNNVKKIKTTEKCFEKCDDLKKKSVIKLQVIPEKYNEKNNITQKKREEEFKNIQQKKDCQNKKLDSKLIELNKKTNETIKMKQFSKVNDGNECNEKVDKIGHLNNKKNVNVSDGNLTYSQNSENAIIDEKVSVTPKDKDNNNNFKEIENTNKIVKNELISTYRKLDQNGDKKIVRKKAFADMRSIVRDSFDEGKVNDEKKKEINKMEKPEAWFDNNTGEN